MSKRGVVPARGMVPAQAQEAFFARLPVDRFMDYEDELLASIQQLTVLVSKFLPRCVSLQEWAERRIPAELASSVNASGIVFVEDPDVCAQQDALEMEAAGPAQAKRRRAQDPASDPKVIKWKSVQDEPARTLYVQAPTASRARQEVAVFACVPEESVSAGIKRPAHVGANPDFLSSLPKATFTQEETNLRQAIFDFIGRWEENEPLLLHHMCASSDVFEARRACMPLRVTLMSWCEQRMGNEIAFEQVESGQVIVKVLVGDMPNIPSRSVIAAGDL